jgi:acetylglutamate kinase
MQPADVVLRFLESVGRADEAQFYLALFRGAEKERFAALHVDANVVKVAAEAVALELSFLAALGLVPVVTVGLFAPADVTEQARALERRLVAAGVPAALVGDDAVADTARRAVVPVVPLDGRVERLGALLGRIGSRKLIFVTRAGGFRIRGALVPFVNLTTEAAALAGSRELSRKQQAILGHARRLVLEATHRMTVSVTAPLDLLRELFTVKGAGTLLRRGAVIVRRTVAEVDRTRLTALLEASFGRALAPDFLDRTDGDLHLEEGYRGVALVVPVPLGGYLSKFAVEREAQGEGLGRDLWDSVAAAHARVFWRARATNPIAAWYAKIADGLVRFDDWHVFWRGLPVADVPGAVEHALSQPVDWIDAAPTG